MLSKLSNLPLILLLWLCLESIQAAEPVIFEAKYQAKASGMTATAKRSLSRNDNGEYLLRNKMELKLARATISSVDERSHFIWQQDRLIPQSYEYQQKGFSRRKEVVDFDWQANMANTTRGSDSWQTALKEGIFDKLNFYLKLRQDLAAHAVTELVYQVVDRDEIDEYRFNVVAEEVVSTPLGDLNAIKISRQYRPGSKRKTIFWLAADWDYLLVKLQQVNSSGVKTELTLKRASVDGTPVVGL